MNGWRQRRWSALTREKGANMSAVTHGAAWLLLGESISLLQLAGMALVMLGVAKIKR
jgi:drug/metabolite transporter (DMT)-like permease